MVASTDAAPDVRRDLEEITSRVCGGEKPSAVRIALDEVTATIESLNSSAERASADICREIEALVALLRSRERDMLATLEDQRWKKLQPLESQREGLERLLSSVERCVRISQASTKKLTDEQLLECAGWLRRSLTEASAFEYGGPAADGFLAFKPSTTAIVNTVNESFGSVAYKQVAAAQCSLENVTKQDLEVGREAVLKIRAADKTGRAVAGDHNNIGIKIEVKRTNDGSITPVRTVPGAESVDAADSYRVEFLPDAVGTYRVSATTLKASICRTVR